MRREKTNGLAATLAALAALAFAAAATAAYTSPKLSVSYPRGRVRASSRRQPSPTTRPRARRS